MDHRLEKNYVAILYNEAMKKIRNNAIKISADEATDRRGRYMALLICKKMSIKLSPPHLNAYREFEISTTLRIEMLIIL